LTKGKFIAGANIYIDGTYDGATTNENGQFSFSTTATETKYLLLVFLFMKLVKQQLMLLIFKIKQSFY
jgi:hypothetical protein